MNQTMKAVVQRRYGRPSVLEICDVALPTPADGEVLIRVHASAANRTDCGFIRGRPLIVRLFSGLRTPKFSIPGSEFAGEVVEVCSGVTEFAAGDRVFGFKDDDFGFGALAEFTVMSTSGMLALMPPGSSFVEVASTAEGAHYALSSLLAADIRRGEAVLVNGATGAIGSAAVQLLVERGAAVTAVCGTDHVDLVRSLGVERVVDYKNEDFTRLDTRFDVVLDAVGKSSFGACKRLLNDGGIYMSTELGPWMQNPFLALWSKWFGRKRVLFPIPKNRKADMVLLRDMIVAGTFRPLVDRVYPLDQIVEAFRYVETGEKIGNVVIQIG